MSWRRRDPAAHAAFQQRLAAGIRRAIDALDRPIAAAVADHLNWHGHRTKAGRHWNHSSVAVTIAELRAGGLLDDARLAKYRRAGRAAQSEGRSAQARRAAAVRQHAPAPPKPTRTDWPADARFTDVDRAALRRERLFDRPVMRPLDPSQSYCGNSSAMCCG